MPRTAHRVTIAAPLRRAASAIAGAARCGSALPSLAVNRPPAQSPVSPGISSTASARVNSRVSS